MNPLVKRSQPWLIPSNEDRVTGLIVNGFAARSQKATRIPTPFFVLFPPSLDSCPRYPVSEPSGHMDRPCVEVMTTAPAEISDGSQHHRPLVSREPLDGSGPHLQSPWLKLSMARTSPAHKSEILKLEDR